MAEGKNKVIIYPDWIHNFSDLTDEELGKLMRHFFEYINDMNPILTDRVLKIAWKPIELTLKRDLKKWAEYVDKQKVNGEKGGRPQKAKETQKTQAFIEKPKKADSVSVSVSDNVNVSDINSLNLIQLEKNLEDVYNSEIWKNKVCSSQKLTILEFEKLFQNFKAKVITAGELKTVGMIQQYFASWLPLYRESILNNKTNGESKQQQRDKSESERNALAEIARQQLNASFNNQG